MVSTDEWCERLRATLRPSPEQQAIVAVQMERAALASANGLGNMGTADDVGGDGDASMEDEQGAAYKAVVVSLKERLEAATKEMMADLEAESGASGPEAKMDVTVNTELALRQYVLHYSLPTTNISADLNSSWGGLYWNPGCHWPGWRCWG